MSALLGIAVLLIFGPGFFALGVWSLRTKAWRESVPLAEVLVDRIAGAEPPPRNTWDRRFALLQAWLFTVFGALAMLGFAALVIADYLPEYL